MCGGGGGSKPPDYTAERNQLKADTLADYLGQMRITKVWRLTTKVCKTY